MSKTLIYLKFDPMGVSRAQKFKIKHRKITYFCHYVPWTKIPVDMNKSLEGKNDPYFWSKIENGGHSVVQACKLVTTYLETDLLIVSLFSFFLCYLTKAVH